MKRRVCIAKRCAGEIAPYGTQIHDALSGRMTGYIRGESRGGLVTPGVTKLVTAADTLAEKQAIAAAHNDWSTSALWVFLAAYVVFAFMTWFYYLRRSFAIARVPSLAHAGV